MGCCFSSDDDKIDQDSSINEASRLLGDPVRNSANFPTQSESYQSTVPAQTHRGDEQAALNRILHETATRVIDVAADSNPIEQHEYLNRAREYSSRLSVVCRSDVLKRPSFFTNNVLAPQLVLAAEPMSLEDIQLISNALSRASVAVKQIKVQHKEDLVVPFGVP